MSVTNQQVVSLLENVLFESATQAAADAASWQANPAAASIASLAAAMAASPEESIAAHIVGYYLSALGRAPTAAEIQFYASYAEKGLTQAQIAAGQVAPSTWDAISSFFTHSQEFSAHAGIDNSLGPTPALLEAVPWLFESVLGRTPNSTEIAYYDNAVLSGAGFNTLLTYFTNSKEFAADTSAQIAAALANYGAAAASGQQPAATIGATITLGPPPPPAPPVTTPSAPSYVFTTGTDDFTYSGAHNYTATLGGSSPTLTANDGLIGVGNTLTITDHSGAASQDILPSGLAMSGLIAMTLTTSGNAGTDTSTTFDVSGPAFMDLSTLTVDSSGTHGDFFTLVTGGSLVLHQHGASSTVGVAGNFDSVSITSSSLTSLDLASANAGTVDLIDPSGSASLTLNVSGVTLSGFTDDSNHVSTLAIAGSGTASTIDAITDTALASLTVSGAVTLGSSGTHISLSSSLTTLALSGDTAAVYVDVNSAASSTITLGSGNNALTDDHGGNVITAGNGNNTIISAGSVASDTITVGNGANSITDNSSGSGGGITVGTGYNTIDLVSHAGSVLHLGPDANYFTDSSTPNVVVEHATAGVTVKFTGDPSLAQYALENHSETDVATLIQDLEFDVQGSPRAAVAQSFGGNTYIVESATGVIGATDTVIVELIGIHGINISSSQIVLTS